MRTRNDLSALAGGLFVCSDWTVLSRTCVPQQYCCSISLEASSLIPHLFPRTLRVGSRRADLNVCSAVAIMRRYLRGHKNISTIDPIELLAGTQISLACYLFFVLWCDEAANS